MYQLLLMFIITIVMIIIIIAVIIVMFINIIIIINIIIFIIVKIIIINWNTIWSIMWNSISPWNKVNFTVPIRKLWNTLIMKIWKNEMQNIWQNYILGCPPVNEQEKFYVATPDTWLQWHSHQKSHRDKYKYNIQN